MHIRVLGKTKKRDKDFYEILSAVTISVTIGILAGFLLTKFVDKLYLIPGLLIILPGFLETQGNIMGSLGARIGTSLNVGRVKKETTTFIKGNIIASIFLAIIVGFVLGLAGFLTTYLVFGIVDYNLLFIIPIACILAVIIEIPLVIWTSFWLFRKGYDPDDIVGPYVVAIGDVISVVSLFIVVVGLL